MQRLRRRPERDRRSGRGAGAGDVGAADRELELLERVAPRWTIREAELDRLVPDPRDGEIAVRHEEEGGRGGGDEDDDPLARLRPPREEERDDQDSDETRGARPRRPTRLRGAAAPPRDGRGAERLERLGAERPPEVGQDDVLDAPVGAGIPDAPLGLEISGGDGHEESGNRVGAVLPGPERERRPRRDRARGERAAEPLEHPLDDGAPLPRGQERRELRADRRGDERALVEDPLGERHPAPRERLDGPPRERGRFFGLRGLERGVGARRASRDEQGRGKGERASQHGRPDYRIAAGEP